MHTVLIVDDEEPIIESYSFILDQGVEGFTLAGIARNGNEAVSRIHDLRPDVVFLDINMPGLDGLEVMERVHADFPGTVFVLSTAYERFDIAKRAIPLGVFAYLVKPVTKKVFVETLDAIREELSRRKTLRDPGTAALLVNRFLREDAWKEIDEGGWSRIRETLSVEADFGIVAFVELDSEQDNLFPRINTLLDLKHRFLFTTHLGKGMYFFPGAQERSLISSSIERCVATSVPKDVLSIIGVGSSRSYRELHRSALKRSPSLGTGKTLPRPACASGFA
jgi:two-component system response regulator YesN